ncbi:hypothetical protein [Microbispora sp. CA-102843]|jgi:hypothetical protein|uniref:hypothetical protein n=1 Tax=Microbispora sp. CA-102843 TaxID=3239952 RepID=UPI003D92DE7E
MSLPPRALSAAVGTGKTRSRATPEVAAELAYVAGAHPREELAEEMRAMASIRAR